MTFEDVKKIILKYVQQWNDSTPRTPLWALAASLKAGIHFRFNGHFIVVNSDMIPESVLTTFFHEYGHAKYERDHAPIDVVESEMAAIRSSLELCTQEGFESLAYREAEAIKQIASQEPYTSAAARLSADALWRKYARLD